MSNISRELIEAALVEARLTSRKILGETSWGGFGIEIADVGEMCEFAAGLGIVSERITTDNEHVFNMLTSARIKYSGEGNLVIFVGWDLED